MAQIEPFVSQVYALCGTLEPFAVADHLNIEYRYVPFLKNPEGQFLKVKGKPLILLNEELQESNRRYFIMAHELYHAIAHEDLSGYYISTPFSQGKLENEANQFAVRYLYYLFLSEEGVKPESYYDLHYKYGIDLSIAEDFI